MTAELPLGVRGLDGACGLGGRAPPCGVYPAALTSTQGRVYRSPALPDARRLGPRLRLGLLWTVKEPASATPTPSRNCLLVVETPGLPSTGHANLL